MASPTAIGPNPAARPHGVCDRAPRGKTMGMCGRGDVSYSEMEVREALAALGESDIHIDLSSAQHDVRPTQPVPVARPVGPHLRLDPIVWRARGPTSKSKAPLLLVRAESVANGALASRERGVVLFTRFYEWQGEKGTKRKPYAARDPRAPILALAALISSALLPDGEVREACTIITQPALGALIPIHDRMPLLVPPPAFGHQDEALSSLVATLRRPTSHPKGSRRVSRRRSTSGSPCRNHWRTRSLH